MTKIDEKYISQCFTLAKKGSGFVSPNPLVGAIIVKKNKVLGQGYHKSYGGPHAEVNAIKNAEKKYGPSSLKGATLYCNLEPCFHHGKTGPCVELILQKKIARVVISNKDPNPKVAGQSIHLLEKSGVDVSVNLLIEEGEYLNRSFFYWIKNKKPYVILKMALSLDGKITPASKSSGWITGPEARTAVHHIRRDCDAILVGRKTVENDNPLLNVRGTQVRVQPYRIILDSQLRSKISSRVFKDDPSRVILVTRNQNLKRKAYENLGIQLWNDDNSSLDSLLFQIGAQGISSVLVEGGAEIFSSFAGKGLFNEVRLFLADTFIGKEGKSLALNALFEKNNLSFYSLKKWGRDFELTYFNK